MNIIIDRSQVEPDWPDERIAGLAEFALTAEGAPERCEVSVTLVTEDEIARLNEEYREIASPTDVLSFPLDDPWSASKDDEVIAIGDIMIATSVAAAQAPGFGNSFDDEMSLLLVHGCLHLLGYDHIDDEEAEVMEQHERDILAAWREREGADAR